MARILFSALLASTMALSAHSSPLLPRTVATCNIDTEPFLTSYAVNACAAMNSTITLTGTTTIIVQPEPSFPYVAVFLTQENVNWYVFQGSSLPHVFLLGSRKTCSKSLFYPSYYLDMFQRS